MKVLCLVLLAVTAIAQTKAPKVFHPPENRIVDPLIARNEGCLKDLLGALKLEGLQQRKLVVDLFTYGCVERLKGSYYVNILGLRELNKIQVRRVHLISTDGPKTADGWIFSRDIVDLAEIWKLLDRVAAERKQ
jgi:hypothetical protein